MLKGRRSLLKLVAYFYRSRTFASTLMFTVSFRGCVISSTHRLKSVQSFSGDPMQPHVPIKQSISAASQQASESQRLECLLCTHEMWVQ